MEEVQRNVRDVQLGSSAACSVSIAEAYDACSLEVLQRLWNEGVESGPGEPLDLDKLRREAVRIAGLR
jgi:hypothetical protein